MIPKRLILIFVLNTSFGVFGQGLYQSLEQITIVPKTIEPDPDPKVQYLEKQQKKNMKNGVQNEVLGIFLETRTKTHLMQTVKKNLTLLI